MPGIRCQVLAIYHALGGLSGGGGALMEVTDGLPMDVEQLGFHIMGCIFCINGNFGLSTEGARSDTDDKAIIQIIFNIQDLPNIISIAAVGLASGVGIRVPVLKGQMVKEVATNPLPIVLITTTSTGRIGSPGYASITIRLIQIRRKGNDWIWINGQGIHNRVSPIHSQSKSVKSFAELQFICAREFVVQTIPNRMKTYNAESFFNVFIKKGNTIE